MNIVELVEKFGDTNVVFGFPNTYRQVVYEIFYFKNDKVYKTTIDNLDFRGDVSTFVWSQAQTIDYKNGPYEFEKKEIDEKKTIKATLEYGNLL